MQRAITGFATDAVGDPIALLSCGHPQHVRHRPPFFDRPWVTSETGRAGMLGRPLECVRCDRLELPAHFIPYKQTTVFTEATVPAGLLHDHTTRAGVWARIVVVEGSLRYHVEALGLVTLLTPDAPGIVAPELAHRIEPVGAVRFLVAFYRAPASADATAPPDDR